MNVDGEQTHRTHHCRHPVANLFREAILVHMKCFQHLDSQAHNEHHNSATDTVNNDVVISRENETEDGDFVMVEMGMPPADPVSCVSREVPPQHRCCPILNHLQKRRAQKNDKDCLVCVKRAFHKKLRRMAESVARTNKPEGKHDVHSSCKASDAKKLRMPRKRSSSSSRIHDNPDLKSTGRGRTFSDGAVFYAMLGHRVFTPEVESIPEATGKMSRSRAPKVLPLGGEQRPPSELSASWSNAYYEVVLKRLKSLALCPAAAARLDALLKSSLPPSDQGDSRTVSDVDPEDLASWRESTQVTVPSPFGSQRDASGKTAESKATSTFSETSSVSSALENGFLTCVERSCTENNLINVNVSKGECYAALSTSASSEGCKTHDVENLHKLIFVGKSQVGKTSIACRLRKGRDALLPVAMGGYISNRPFRISRWQPDETQSLAFNVYDFSGHERHRVSAPWCLLVLILVDRVVCVR